MKKILAIIIVIAAILSSCEDPYADSAYSASADVLPAASYLDKTDSLNVNLWVELLRHTDLFNTLNLQANYTCFVPNNKAVEAYLNKKGVSKVSELNIDDAKLLVRYHTIKGTKYSSVDFQEGLIPDTTATGDYLSTSFSSVGGAILVNMEATVTKTIQVTNAYVHIVNTVLTPVTETLWDKLQNPDFTIFKEAVELTGLREMLNTIVKMEEGASGQLLQRKYRYTLFAVPNSIFIANGINDITALKSYLNAASDYTMASNELNKYVTYHLVNQQISYSVLSAFAADDKVRSKNINTMAPNQLINISDLSNVLYINYNQASAQGTKLSQINLNCKNGVMHVVDGIMPIESPKPTKVQWELTAYPEIGAAIPSYRVTPGNSTYTYYLLNNAFESYVTLTVPDSRQGLAYVLANKNEAELKKSIYSDYLIVSLGMFGWVEMQSPAIVAGKYNVFIEHYNFKGAEKQGKLSFIIDGNYIGGQITTNGNSKTSDKFTKTLIGQLEFSETTTHKLRILAGDTFSSYLDCLTFEPIFE